MSAPAKPGASAPAPRKAARPAPARRRERVPAAAPALEHDADRIATGAMSSGAPLFGSPRPLAPRTALSSLPAVAQRALRESGQPLDQTTRAFMESRLGYDFSGIRIHAGAEAARGAGALGAHAFAAGDRIVFDAGQYRPHDNQGRWLLAHELAHIVQQAHGATPALLHKDKDKPPVKFYQAVIDQVKYQHGTPNGNPDYFITNERLLKLCEAVDAGNTGDIPMLIDGVIRRTFSVLGELNADLLAELAARIGQLGLDAEAEKLRKAYRDDIKDTLLAGTDAGQARRTIAIMTKEVDLAIGAIDLSNGDAVRNTFVQLQRAVAPLRDAYLDIDPKDLQEEQRSLRDDPGMMALAPSMLYYQYFDALTLQLRRLIGTIETVIQTLMDSARVELENGVSSGGDKLNLLYNWMTQDLRPVLEKPRAGRSLAGVQIPILHVDFTGKGKGLISDAFPTAKGTRKVSVPITSYDPQQEGVADQTSSIAQLYNNRLAQIRVLAQIYGVPDLVRRSAGNDRDQAIDNLEDMESNQRAIDGTPKKQLRLNSDDDWRDFVMAKFTDLTQPPPGQARLRKSDSEALHAVATILFAYLKAFTVHVHAVNIYDIGTSYVNRPFPRALSGQIIHDCGVYAIRVAYILSRVRDALGLKFHFVLMPAHIGLVMEKPGLQTFIFENDSMDEIPPARVEELRDAFDSFIEDPSTTGGEDPADKLRRYKKDNDQFIGEMAAADYIGAPVDMPFRLFDVPSDANTAALQNKLWRAYENNVDDPSDDVLGPPSRDKNDPNYLFHQRYLGLTQHMRDAHNDAMLPFWNVAAPNAWDAMLLKIKAAGAHPNAGTLVPLVAEYCRALDAAYAPYDKQRKEIDAEAQAISDTIKHNPKLVAKTARLSYGRRAFSFLFDRYGNYRKHVATVLTGLRAVPPGNAVDLDDLLSPFSAGDPLNIFPPFMPRDKARLDPAE